MARSKSKNNGASTKGLTQITGRGDYRTSIADLKQRVDRIMRLAPKGSFARAGTAAGMALGGPLGATIGGTMGRGLSAITGYGDYQVKSNSLSTISTSMDTVPQFVRNDHAVRVIHREFVKDVVVPSTPGAFTNNTFVINPSNEELFPWLSSLSKQYQQYNIRGMIVEFKSMSSDYAASGPLGTVAIATNYNVNDTPFLTKIALENSEFAVSCKPSMSLIHAIECDPEFSGRKFYYVRDSGSEGSAVSDARLYDVGLLQVATAGLPGNVGATLGELWVSYDIEFTKPVLPSFTIPPVLTNGQIVTSQRDGSYSKTDGAIGEIFYTQSGQPALTASGTRKPFAGTMANVTITGDSQLDLKVCSITNIGKIFLWRDGYYRIRYSAHADTTAANGAYRALATQATNGGITTGGSGVASAVFQETVADYAFTASGDDVRMLLSDIIVTVSGCGVSTSLDNYVQVEGPQITTHSGALCVPTYSVLSVTWTQLNPGAVVV